MKKLFSESYCWTFWSLLSGSGTCCVGWDSESLVLKAKWPVHQLVFIQKVFNSEVKIRSALQSAFVYWQKISLWLCRYLAGSTIPLTSLQSSNGCSGFQLNVQCWKYFCSPALLPRPRQACNTASLPRGASSLGQPLSTNGNFQWHKIPNVSLKYLAMQAFKCFKQETQTPFSLWGWKGSSHHNLSNKTPYQGIRKALRLILI